MEARMAHLKQRIQDLEKLADEVAVLAKGLYDGNSVQPELSVKGERWYRGVRELLVQEGLSTQADFEQCYESSMPHAEITHFIHRPGWDMGDSAALRKICYDGFKKNFLKARALALSCFEELESREHQLRTQLSFALSADEFDTALALITASHEEPILRASGVVARVALERHLFTVAESRQLKIEVNPPSKKKADISDVLGTLAKNNILKPIQRSELDSLLTIANNCAHPKEAVTTADVLRLITRARELASLIL